MKRILWLFVMLALAASASAQTITQIQTVPPGLTVTNAGTIQATFTLTGFTPPVNVQFQRDDFATDTVAGLNNGPGTITLVLSDLPTSDGRPTSWNVVATDAAVPPNVRTVFNAVRVRYDNSPPNLPIINTPNFPATIFGDTFQIRGTVSGTSGPVTTGTVLVTRRDPPNVGVVIGAGALTINPAGSFIATVDISRLTTGVATQIRIQATDEAGNVGQPLDTTVTRQIAPPPTLTAPTCQPVGPLTNSPAVLLRGSATGQVPPFTIHFFVDGTLESQVAGLADQQQFAHTLNLPSEGRHTISIQATNSNTPPDQSRAVVVCQLTLDTIPSAPPLITQPNAALPSLVTSGPSFLIEGFSQERAFCTTNAACPRPKILLSGPSGVAFTPASPLTPDDTSSRFNTTVTLPGTLVDGRYTIRVTSVDAAGNTSSGSSRDVIFDLDRARPSVTEIRINNVLAPQSTPEIFVGRQSAAVLIRTSEPLVNVPVVRFTQVGGSQQALGLTSGAATVFNYLYTASTGQDGPVNAAFSGGKDAAGNEISQAVARLFIVDTTPPRLTSVTPSNGTTVARSPNPIRIVLEDPLDSTMLASGVDTVRTQIVLEGPLGAATPPAVPGTSVPFDPRTIDFVPGAPLTADGTYRLTITPIDRVGNLAQPIIVTFVLDTTPIRLAPGLIQCTPPDGAFVNPQTVPGTFSTPFVAARVNSTDFSAARSLIEVSDFCRAPPRVPGTKVIAAPDRIQYTFAGPLATDGSQDGTYFTAITLSDSVGNLSPQTFCTFVYDSLPPLVDRTFPTAGSCTNGPLRLVDATLLDPRPDVTCRIASGIDRGRSSLRLFLVTPNPFSNTKQPREITGVLRFQSVGNFDKIALEVVNAQQVPVGLANDGTDDGIYRLDVIARDRSGNASPLTSASFTYDTRAPELTVDKIKDNDAITGPTVTLTGNVRDNAGGGDVERVIASLISVDVSGNPTTSVPTFVNVTATLNPLAEPNSGTPPRRTWTLAASMVNVSLPFRGRLTVTALDRCGNARDQGFFVRVEPGRLGPPTLSVPANLSCTPSNLIDFVWTGVNGAACYQLEIVTPKGNEITIEINDPRLTQRVNLGQQGDGDGQYRWRVAARDGGRALGSFSRYSVFNIDTTPPRVLAVDAQDPSPESRGVLTAGETRFTITFNEKMSLEDGLSVELVPENRSLPPLIATTTSFLDNVWTGRLIIPQNGNREPDYNGLAELLITKGRDCARNVMAAPDHGLVVFEVNTGPLLKIAFFQNPIDRRDLIVLLKGFTREGGPSARLIDLPTVTFIRAGEKDQAPKLTRINDSTFQGLFRLNPNTTVPITLLATARDEGGNTASRTIALNVSNVGPGEALVVNASTAVRLELPGGAVREAATLFAMPRRYSLATDKVEVPADGALIPVAAIEQLSPLGFSFAEPARVVVETEELPGVLAPDLLPRAALYQKTAAGWEYLPQTRAGTQLTAEVMALNPLALLHDGVSPEVRNERPLEGAKLDPADPALEADLTDRGSGLDRENLHALLDGKAVPITLDAATGRARADLSGARPGEHEVVLAVADRAGNVTRTARKLVAVPAFGLTEVVPFPNPARLSSRIRYRLAGPVNRVELKIYDVSGRLLRKLEGDTGTGRQTAEWPLDTDSGDGVANGVYLVRVTASGGGRTVTARTRIAVMR